MSATLAMSDEEFLKLNDPVAEASVEVTEPVVEEVAETVAEDVPEAVVPPETPAEGVTEKDPDDAEVLGSIPSAKVEVKDADLPVEAPVGEGKDKNKEEVAPVEAINYEDLYNKIMAPFKANGKSIEVRNPDEAVKLMQMGANYTRKMQELAPHRKVLLMLEKNGLMDEGKLSYLIDLDKKNPDAIHKLVKDSGIDPMDMDTSKESQYRETNHRVGDEEIKFLSALDDMKSTQEGLGTIQVINADWDTASKEHLWKSPEVLSIIHSQRESGIYDQINKEVNRQKALGTISADVPFLQAYQTVGERMSAANAFVNIDTPSPSPKAPVVVATRVATPKPTISNSVKANAAASNRTTPVTAKAFVNPLAQSDDEFMKQFNGRG